MVRLDDLEAFGREHVLLDVLSKERGEAALAVRNRLTELGIRPVYEASPKATRVYRRNEIESAGF